MNIGINLNISGTITVDSSPPPSTLLDGLLHYWKLNADALASAGVGNLTNNGGVAFQDGAALFAYDNAQSLTLPSGESVQSGTADRTFVIRVKFVPHSGYVFPGPDYVILSKPFEIDGTDEYGLQMNHDDATGRNFEFWIADGDQAYPTCESGSVNPTFEDEHLLMAWIDNTNLVIGLQVDGNPPATVPIVGNNPVNDNPFRIGNYAVSDLYPFSGYEKECGIWGKVLSVDERAALVAGAVYPFS